MPHLTYRLLGNAPERFRQKTARAVIKKAKRLAPIRGFGIDQIAAVEDEPAQANPRGPVFDIANLDTDLPPPPEALAVKTDQSNGLAATRTGHSDGID